MVNDIIAYVTLFAQKGAQISVNSRNQINNVDSLSIKMLNFVKLHGILKDLFIKEKCFFLHHGVHFSNENTETILSYSTRKLLWFEISKMPIEV